MTHSSLIFYKEQYNGHKIIYVRFSDSEFVFRTLTRKEYRYIKLKGLDDYETQDAICNLACLYPKDYDFNECPFAGLIPYVSHIIEELSGFTDINVVLEDYYKEKQKTNLEVQCMDLIKAFIPEYTYEQMEEWTWEKLITMTARAERVAKLKGFELELQDQSQSMVEEYNKMNSDNEEFIDELNKKGIDPMFYFRNEIDLKKDIIDFPLIGGTHWNDEVILDAIRRQINKKKARE